MPGYQKPAFTIFKIEYLAGQQMAASGRSINRKGGALANLINMFRQGGQLFPTAAGPIAGPRPPAPVIEPNIPFADWLERTGNDVVAVARDAVADLPPGKSLAAGDVDSFGDAIEWAIESVAQGVASSVPSLVGGVLGGIVGGAPGAIWGATAPSYLLVQNEVRRSLEEEGVDQELIDAIAPKGSQ